MLEELEADYKPKASLITAAFIFAALHFIKPIDAMLATSPQFPGLFLLGAIVIIAKRRNRNLLGMSIGLHAGMIWAYYIINVGKIVEYSGRVPDWVTGINGNPLSGILGLIFLTLLAISISKFPSNIDRDNVKINY
jgi:membrane protease YdiL (CAAX protease family)